VVFSIFISQIVLSQTSNYTEDTTVMSIDGGKIANRINGKPFHLDIKLLTYNRVASFKRCITSLANALYDGDTVDIQVFVDHFQDVPNMSQEEHDSKLKLHYQILSFLENFEWKHGKILVHYRHKNANLQFAWMEAFYPLDDYTYAFIVEDDMAVSPFYYLYLKKLLAKYRYGNERYERMYGISFQRQTLVPGNTQIRVDGVKDNDNQPYLYPLIGTWGQIVFPEHWRAFRKYFDERRYLSQNDETLKPYLVGSITNKWYREKKENIWTPWIIRWAFSNNYYNLYTNFPGRKALSTSFRDSGENFKRSVGQDAPLITWKEKYGLWQEQYKKQLDNYQRLKKFDYCFREVSRGKLYDLSKSHISELPKLTKDTVLVINMAIDEIKYLKNQMCFIEWQTTRSVEAEMKSTILFYTDSYTIADELQERGYNVILARGIVLSDTVLQLLESETNLLVIEQKNHLFKQLPTFQNSTSQSSNDWVVLNTDALLLLSDKEYNTFAELKYLIPESTDDLQSKPVIISDLIHIDTIETWNNFSLIKDDDLACSSIRCNR
jgi:hypothetical protein